MAQYRFKIKTMTQKYNECQTQIKDITKDELTVRSF